MDLPESFPPLTLDDKQLYKHVTSLTPADKRKLLQAVKRLNDCLLADILPKAVLQCNVTFSLDIGQTKYHLDDFTAISIKLNVTAPNLANGARLGAQLQVKSFYVRIPGLKNPRADIQLIGMCAFIRDVFGPKPDTLYVAVPQFQPPATSLCARVTLLQSDVQFKPHNDIESLLADLTFEGIAL